MTDTSNAAVIVSNACKKYGKNVILNNLNLRVDKGTIYGLLGPSGCGKTTLLSCIVGVKNLNSGNLWVLGGKPGSRKSGVPGPRVGYMPQDVALVPEFTVREAVYFFGRIFNLPTDKIKERFKFLVDLLDLPDKNRFVRNCSGGQQRRVSFASAMVHEAELLILDEPTVGLDPVLREKIWNYLAELTTKTDTSVIITTHYIDETKQAHKIGLMRGGRLLADESPNNLLLKYQKETLEDVFLLLSVKHAQIEKDVEEGKSGDIDQSLAEIENNVQNSSNPNNYDSREDFGKMQMSSTDALTEIESNQKTNYVHKSSLAARYKALMVRDIQQFIRHPSGLFFSSFFPVLTILAFFAAVGHDPRSLDLAVVNHEFPNIYDSSICNKTSLKDVTYVDDEVCTFNLISCRFLHYFDTQTPGVRKRYMNATEARDQFNRGKVIAEIHFSHNFTQAIHGKFDDLTSDDPDIVDFSIIDVHLDTTDYQLSQYIKRQMLDTYDDFSTSVNKDCKFLSNRTTSVPMVFNTPIFGSKHPSYTHYMAPGLLITVLFFLASTTTSTIMISERLEGVWDRSMVAGIKPKEILLCHVALQSLVTFMQLIELMIMTFIIFDVPAKGSFITTGALLFIDGLGGMAFGFLLSVISNSFTMSFYLASGSFYPLILLCGVLWPIESMPTVLRYFSRCLPFTIPTEALRNVLHKGYVFLDFEIYTAFIVCMSWFIGLLLLCIFILWLKK